MELGSVAPFSANLSTNYEYFTSGGIHSGLQANGSKFKLNNKEMFIYSGAMHYFRVPRPYWRDRLKKLRAAGLNTVETYVPWNLHEPTSGEFDFGDKDNDMSDFLHLKEFLAMAKEEDLFAIVRPGPYICSEFEFGGFPSWLLREEKIDFRTSNPIYMKYVTRYWNILLQILTLFQFTKGGPIIAFQVENEYASSQKHDLEYLKMLRQILLDHGIEELLVTSDNNLDKPGSIPELFFMTGNFQHDAKRKLDKLKALQPNRPVMVMEYWSGWFDTWSGRHSSYSTNLFRETYETILSYPASVNLYMFHGGTNFGFLNGASTNVINDENSDYRSDISSYDYLAPLNEAGNYTEKYWAVRDLVKRYNPVQTVLPDPPKPSEVVAYPTIRMEKQLHLEDLLSSSLIMVPSKTVIPMEKLNVNNNSGQSFGYVIYRKTNVDIPPNGTLTIEGRVCDTAMVLVNGVLVSPILEKASDIDKFGTFKVKDSSLILSTNEIKNSTIEIVIENWGRINYKVYKQFKGLWQGNVKLNEDYLYDWAIYPLEFKKKWTNSLQGWKNLDNQSVGPCLYKSTLHITGTPKDTFVYMEKWVKGIVIVNGFVIGRYAHMGPIQTLYLPATLLKQGDNSLYVFEHFRPAFDIEFSNQHVYKNY